MLRISATDRQSVVNDQFDKLRRGYLVGFLKLSFGIVPKMSPFLTSRERVVVMDSLPFSLIAPVARGRQGGRKMQNTPDTIDSSKMHGQGDEGKNIEPQTAFQRNLSSAKRHKSAADLPSTLSTSSTSTSSVPSGASVSPTSTSIDTSAEWASIYYAADVVRFLREFATTNNLSASDTSKLLQSFADMDGPTFLTKTPRQISHLVEKKAGLSNNIAKLLLLRCKGCAPPSLLGDAIPLVCSVRLYYFPPHMHVSQ